MPVEAGPDTAIEKSLYRAVHDSRVGNRRCPAMEHIARRIIQSHGTVYSKFRGLSDRPTIAMYSEQKTPSATFCKT
jgi:hypothetical protein